MAGKKERNDTSKFWKNEKVREVFLKMCEMAYRPSVDWEKFREIDERGIFKDFDNSRLSMKFRNLRLRKEGNCWYCGDTKADAHNGLCTECDYKVKEINKAYIRENR